MLKGPEGDIKDLEQERAWIWRVFYAQTHNKSQYLKVGVRKIQGRNKRRRNNSLTE